MAQEPRIPGLRRSLRLPDRHVEDDVADEIAFHLENRVHDLMLQGRTESEARRLAALEFGDMSASRRELASLDGRRLWGERINQTFDGVTRDVRHAWRSLRRSPAYTITTIITLVMGIGAAVAIFAVVNTVLLRPLPYSHPDRLVGAWFDMPSIGLSHAQQSAATYFTFQSQAHTIAGIGIYREGAANVSGVPGAGAPQRLTTAWFTASLFTVLGVRPIRGQLFSDADDRPSAPPVVVISEGTWATQFGRDSHIVGRRLEVDGVRREIIGVMPRTFRFPSRETAVWVPLGLDPANPPPTAFSYNGVARLKPGISVADAQRDFASVLPRVIALYPRFVPGISMQQIMDQVRPIPVLVPLRHDITGAIAATLWVVTGAAALLLLVACVNVANLTLVRFDARQRELGIRETLGAGRARVARYVLMESATVAAAAGVLGVALAWGIVRALLAEGPTDVPRLAELGIGARAILAGVAIAALAAAACGMIPTLRIRAGHLALRDAARGATASRRQHRVRSGLVAAQIALAAIMLSGSGLLLRSFERLHAVRPGFAPEHVTTFWLALPRARYQAAGDVVRFYGRLIDGVAALPGVKSVGVTSRLPLVARGINPNPLYPEDAPEFATRLPPLQSFTTIGGGYFRAMGIPLLAGRLFERMDAQREGEAIISSRTAASFWHDASGVAALGKRFRALPTGPWYTVIGVVGDTHDTTLAAPPSPTVYFPETVPQDTVTPQMVRSMALVVRSASEPAPLIPAVQQVVRTLDASLPMFDVRPMSRVLRASTARLVFIILVVAGAAAVTLILGAVGLYGIMAYVVTLRRRELSIRIALGASPGALAAATVRQGIALTGIGVAAGLTSFIAVAGVVRGFLFGVAAWDPIAVGGATLLLVAVATLASWIPARRAARTDPGNALRSE